MKLKMVKNKSKLAIKLFIIVWIVLAVHIALKLTFNYWQPYVISNDKLQAISDFIDANRWIEIILNYIWYMISGLLLILSGLRYWKFKNKNQFIIVVSLISISFVLLAFFKITTINTLFITIILPIIFEKKKWITILITFGLSNIFLFLSLWLEGFINANDMPYLIAMFLNFDYYIMLVLNYFVFNLTRKENKQNG